MGNYISCTLSSSSGKAPTVIFPNGKTQQFYQPIKAAELMREREREGLLRSQLLPPQQIPIPLRRQLSCRPLLSCFDRDSATAAQLKTLAQHRTLIDR
ncbi:hypothetical protein ACSBR2_026018 [Camellia fascicularis]